MSRRLTQEEYIQRLRIVHGDRYDYSKVKYVNSETKVIIICREHGEFQQKSSNHKRGDDCPKCVGGVKSNTNDFIVKAIKLHENEYNYSKVDYLNNHTKILIICSKHGEFLQAPSKHLDGCGCAKCYGKNRFTTEQFIKKAREVHGDKYDYSKVNYVNQSTKVIIICPIHGEFKQQPNNHLYGKICFICAGRSPLNNRYFKIKAKIVHGDKYDYSKVDYIKSNQKIIIICPEHGEFEQVPTSHLGGTGCPKCGDERTRQKRKKTIEQFIEDAKKVHGDRYDYSKVEYINSNTKLIIICPEHGEFEQIPSSHLNGSGCNKCHGRGFNYLLYSEAKEQIKNFKFKNKKEYYVWWNENEKYCRKIGLPKIPNHTYKKK